jgi:DNA-binding MarR family transcriptional regulator
MPYKITTYGLKVIRESVIKPKLQTDETWYNLTDWQKQVLAYLANMWDEGEKGYIPAHDIGMDLKEHPRAISGIAYSLIKKGLVEKKE